MVLEMNSPQFNYPFNNTFDTYFGPGPEHRELKGGKVIIIQ